MLSLKKKKIQSGTGVQSRSIGTAKNQAGLRAPLGTGVSQRTAAESKRFRGKGTQKLLGPWSGQGSVRGGKNSAGFRLVSGGGRKVWPPKGQPRLLISVAGRPEGVWGRNLTDRPGLKLASSFSIKKRKKALSALSYGGAIAGFRNPIPNGIFFYGVGTLAKALQFGGNKKTHSRRQ